MKSVRIFPRLRSLVSEKNENENAGRREPPGARDVCRDVCRSEPSRATQGESLDGRDCCSSVAAGGPEHRSGSRGIVA